jgi:hypothetical protein
MMDPIARTMPHTAEPSSSTTASTASPATTIKNVDNNDIDISVQESIIKSSTQDSAKKSGKTYDDNDKDLFAMDDKSNWRCICDSGFLPPGMLKTFGSAEAVMRLGTGQCYHKQT